MAADSSHNRWPSADSINPGLASPSQAGNLSSSRSSRSSSAPTPRTPQIGDERIIRVFSQARSVFVDCTALLIDENEKNAISIDLVKTLGLEHTLKENAQEETGKFKGMHIVFEGMAVITWSWKEPPLSNHSNPLTCHVIPYELRRVMLKATLFTPPALSPRLLNTLDAMVSTPSSPGFSGPLPAPSSLGQSLSPETLGSTAGSSVKSLHAPSPYPEIAGVIDDFGSFYDDSSEKRQWADKWMQDLKSCMAKRIKQEDDPRTMPKVKIAILDTGVDYTHPRIQALKTRGVLVGHRGFVNTEEDSEEATQDTDGHGTHITWLVSQVATRADIYIGKISDGKVVSFRNNRVANAIRWAVEEEVDIISMSFGFPTRHDKIQEAIAQATCLPRRILMFAAASNRGKGHPPTFPANEDSVICIWAADGDGNKSETNAQTESRKTRFATLGVAVESAWLEQKPDVFMARKSGTSVATPIAAGIAACVLEFALQKSMEIKRYNDLKCLPGMVKVFHEMRVPCDGLDFIVPWKLFHDRFETDDVLYGYIKALVSS